MASDLSEAMGRVREDSAIHPVLESWDCWLDVEVLGQP